MRHTLRAAEDGAVGRTASQGFRVLVANEPRLDREVVAAALQRLRPQHTVVIGDPDDLDGHVTAANPDLVICSRIAVPAASAVAWLILPGHNESNITVVSDGRTRNAPDTAFADLLTLIDEVLSARSPRAAPATPAVPLG